MTSTRVWYLVRDFGAARHFYTDKLGFVETFVDEDSGWAKLERGDMRIAIAEGEPQEDGGVAAIDVDDVKSEAERLRNADVNVGVVLELHDEVRMLDVFDPDGNRLQLVEELRLRVIRPGTPQDARFLRDMLRHAYYWRAPEEDEAGRHPMRYVENWDRPGDAAVIALDRGFPVGAAWYRLFRSDRPGYGFVDEQTPELSIAVVPSRRGAGVGGDLMTAILTRAKAEGYTAISLSVAKDSPAVGLYERYGFAKVEERDGAITMRADLSGS